MHDFLNEHGRCHAMLAHFASRRAVRSPAPFVCLQTAE